jgi:photosystem II stability/assembly factor-like uncharacterized protein
MKKIFLLLFFANLLYGADAQVNWIPTNGPYGGSCNKLNLINNEVYCATSCGIFSTNDNGLSWTNKNIGLYTPLNSIYAKNFQDIVIINNLLIAGSYDSGIYISSDNGLNWTQSNNGLLDGSNSENLNLMILDIFINGNEILIGTNNGVFKSTNQGQSWLPSNIGIFEPNNVNALRLSKFGNNIYLQTNNDIYSSSDNGLTWLDLNNNFNAIPFTLVTNSSGIFVSGDLGVYKSTNGVIWTLLNNNLPDSPTRLVESNNNLYCAIPNVGSYYSMNNGLTWNFITSEFYNDFLLHNNTHYMCDLNGVYSSGAAFNLNNCGLGAASATNILFVDGNDIYAGTDNGIYKSSDEGNLWKNMRVNLPIKTNVTCIERSGGNLIIGTKDSGVYISNDNGLTWNQSNNGLNINGEACLNIGMIHYSNGKVFLGAKQNITFFNYGSLFVSTDDGQSWNIVNSGLGNNYNITSMTDFGQYLILGAVNAAGSSNYGVYLSTNSGNSWFYDGLGYPIKDVASNNNEYFAISTGSSVYRTQNLGNTWIEMTNTGTNGALNNIENLNSIIYIQGNNGVLKYLNNGNWLDMGTFGLIWGSGATICQKSNGAIFTGASAYTDFLNGNVSYVQNGVSKYIGNTLGISDENNQNNFYSISLYPNPTTSEITITSDKFTNEPYTLFDQMGRTVGSGKLSGTNTTISLSTLSKGIYILKVEGAYESAIVVKE